MELKNEENLDGGDKKRGGAKRPYLRRGSGMTRYNMTPQDIGRDNQHKITWKKSKPKSTPKLNEVALKDDRDPHLQVNLENINLADHFRQLIERMKLLAPTEIQNSDLPDKKEVVWADLLNGEQQFDYGDDTAESSGLSPSLIEYAMRKDLAEEKLFEIIEKKVLNDSFSSQNSFINAFVRPDLPRDDQMQICPKPSCPSENNTPNTESVISAERYFSTVETDEVKEDSERDEESSGTETEETCRLAINNEAQTSTPNPKELSPRKKMIKIIIKDDQTNQDSTLTNKSIDIEEKTELLKTRLSELMLQTEIFKKENENMLVLKAEMEKERDEFLKSKADTERKLREEKTLMEYQLAEEKEKLAKQMNLYDRRVKEMKNGVQKKEHEEIVKLRDEIISLKEQIATKDARNGAVQSRLRTQIKQLEKENDDLKTERDRLKKECNKLKNSNSRSRKLSNLRALAEINKSLAEFALQSRKSDVIPQTENIVEVETRKRTRSEPNLKATSHYTKFFSERDKAENEKKDQMYRNEEIQSCDDESIEESAPPLIPCLKRNIQTPEVTENNNIEKIYERTFKDDATPHKDEKKEISFPDGSKKIISSDGSYDKFIYNNGDIKETFYDEGTIKYHYKQSDIHRTSYKDGSEVFHYPNGTIERRYKDGSAVIQDMNNSTRYTASDGSEEWTYADGTIVSWSKNGEQKIRFPNGQVEIHASDHKRREFPDGTVKYLYKDGATETRYANGRIRIRDKSGRLILDSQSK